MHLLSQRLAYRECMHEENHWHDGEILEKKNIPLPEGARKKEGGSRSKNKDRFHALVTGYLGSSSFIIDSSSSRNMDSMHDSFSALYPYSGPSILMGDDSEIQAKGIVRIDIEDGYFNNVLFVHYIAAKLLSFYQMTHTSTTKKVTFTQNYVEIS